jgi:hypothetical protein
MFLRALLVLAFAASLTVAAAAREHVYVAGDSLCVGVAQVARLPSVAKNGASTHDLTSQLLRLPEQATVIVCSATNDAVNRNRGIERAVASALHAARLRKQRLIWVGPINTSLGWDTYSDQLDTMIALMAPEYISLRAVDWNWGERAPDQIHLTARGYARVWRLVRDRI